MGFPTKRWGAGLAGVVALATAACGGAQSSPEVEPAGRDMAAETEALRAGADVLQDVAPVRQIGIYLVGLHPMKDEPGRQMIAHHFCHQVNEDFAQCVIYDGNTEDANLNGIEYIISERLFDGLPPGERQYWHPHNYEILSGQLSAPGLPGAAEREFLEKKMNSYGKTWHVWMTRQAGSAGDRLPLGPAMLAWSFNGDGEADPALVQEMASQLEIDLAQQRQARADLAALARPQEGVDALKEELGRTGQPSGVQAKGTSGGSGQPGM